MDVALLELPARVIPRALPERTLESDQDWLDQWLWREAEIALQNLQRLPTGAWMAFPAAQFARLGFVAAVHGYRLCTQRTDKIPGDWIRVCLERQFTLARRP